MVTVRARQQKQYNPHSTGRLNLAAKMMIFGKIMFRVFTNAPCLDTPSAGEFIRWSVALRPTNGETVNSQGAGSAQAPTNPHSNGRIK